MAPVSMRDASERGRLGNRVAAWFVPLPIGERDPVERLARVRETTAGLKQRHEALGAETVTQVARVARLDADLARRAPDASRARPSTWSSPTCRVPRARSTCSARACSRRIRWCPLMGTLGLGIALFSYGRTLSWGFTADWELVPDLHELVLAVEHEFAKLRERAAAREG